MCRLLAIKSEAKFKIADYLKQFARISKYSEEYQGHGWGCAYLRNQQWTIYKNISPIWEDNLDMFGKSNLLLVHTRSAFKDKGINIMNNMPFFNKNLVFIFNGELQGVRIKEEGRIGAEKIFNTIIRISKNMPDGFKAFKKAMELIKTKTGYIKAMNIIMANRESIFLNSIFNENPQYFSLYKNHYENKLLISSRPLFNDKGWGKIPNQTTGVFG
jgi:glutamine amidotransferase